MSTILVIRIKKKGGQKQNDNAQIELEVINNLNRVAPTIKDFGQLEAYLTSINEDIKKHESDYTFLIAFHDIIRKIRERLGEDDIRELKNQSNNEL